MKIRPQATCHQLEPHYADGLCKVCFYKARYLRSRPIGTKPKELRAACHTDSEHYSAGLCYECYSVQRPPTRKRNIKRMADCHPERLHYSGGLCQQCYDQRKHKSTYPKNRERRIKSQKQWYRNNKVHVFYRELKRNFGISREQYDVLLKQQHHRCAICKGEIKDVRRGYLCVDHDHTCCLGKKSCGKCVRGLLCITCNTGIGNLHDSIELLKCAIDYLTPKP